MPKLDISTFFNSCQLNDSVLSESSTGNPRSEFFSKTSIDWSNFPINSNTLIFTTTLKPTKVNPLGLTNMESVIYNQQSRFEEFIYKNRKLYTNIYYVTEKQKNGNYHWHGFIDIKDAQSLICMIARMRKDFGRSEICQPYRAYKDWYNYCHQSKAIMYRHNITGVADSKLNLDGVDTDLKLVSKSEGPPV